MYSSPVYLGSYSTFPTKLSKYRVFTVEGFLVFFMKFSLNIGKRTNMENILLV
jgi:hypothetical protein